MLLTAAVDDESLPIAASVNAATENIRALQIQSINYFQDSHVSLIILFMNLVLSYDFNKICWPDVRRGNRFECEFEVLVISLDVSYN